MRRCQRPAVLADPGQPRWLTRNQVLQVRVSFVGVEQAGDGVTTVYRFPLARNVCAQALGSVSPSTVGYGPIEKAALQLASETFWAKTFWQAAEQHRV